VKREKCCHEKIIKDLQAKVARKRKGGGVECASNIASSGISSESSEDAPGGKENIKRERGNGGIAVCIIIIPFMKASHCDGIVVPPHSSSEPHKKKYKRQHMAMMADVQNIYFM
jgi:hypothetical protein